MIVAVSPMLAGRIEYDPQIPALRDGLTRHVPQGSVIKFEAVYPTPFWRRDGLSGYANSDRPRSSSPTTTPHPGARRACSSVLSSATPPDDWARCAKERRKVVLDEFAHLFGAQGAKPRTLIEHNWSDEPWTRGCYAGYFPPGAWSSYGEALRTPVGGSIGRERRPRRSSWDTWTAPCARASGPPPRCARPPPLL